MDVLYKFINGNKSVMGEQIWEVGKWYKVEGKLSMCGRGFHASEYIQDAMLYVQGDVLAIVETKGNNIVQKDKQCWQKMRVIKTFQWTSEMSVKMAIFASLLVKQEKNYREWANKWMSGEDRTRESAERAARSAVERAARSAVESATWSAERKIEIKKKIHEYALSLAEEKGIYHCRACGRGLEIDEICDCKESDGT